MTQTFAAIWIAFGKGKDYRYTTAFMEYIYIIYIFIFIFMYHPWGAKITYTTYILVFHALTGCKYNISIQGESAWQT